MIYIGNCLEVLSSFTEKSINTCITSPPYWGLRDYGIADQLGLEATPEEYVEKLVSVFRAVRRVLRDDGTVWLNLGDSYSRGHRPRSTTPARYGKYKNTQFDNTCTGPDQNIQHGLKDKDLCGFPWRIAFALQADGWYLRQDIIWSKSNPMPESVKDRCTKSHEYLFLLSKSPQYYFDHEAIKEPSVNNKSSEWKTRNKRSVWTVALKPYRGSHFATFPPDLIEPCVLAGSPVGGTVLDPFFGSGTTGLVAMRNMREYVGIELNPAYVALAKKRLSEVQHAIPWNGSKNRSV